MIPTLILFYGIVSYKRFKFQDNSDEPILDDDGLYEFETRFHLTEDKIYVDASKLELIHKSCIKNGIPYSTVALNVYEWNGGSYEMTEIEKRVIESVKKIKEGESIFKVELDALKAEFSTDELDRLCIFEHNTWQRHSENFPIYTDVLEFIGQVASELGF